MIKVSVLYPNSDEAKFDTEYYCNNHMQMVKGKLGSACKEIAVESGICGADPKSSAPYLAMGHLYFDSVDDFQKSFGPHAEHIMGDIPNYTNIEPVIQISEVLI